LLNHNAPDVMKWMQESGMADPVGMIVEMTDDIGKQLTYAALEKQGMPQHEIPEFIESYTKNAIPTFECIVSFKIAAKILSITSETALRNLTASPLADPASPGSLSAAAEQRPLSGVHARRLRSLNLPLQLKHLSNDWIEKTDRFEFGWHSIRKQISQKAKC